MTNKNLYIILTYILTIILCIFSIRQCSKNATAKKQSDHNIEVLTDSIRQYRTLADDVAAERSILIGDIDLLKKTNDSLYNKVKELGVKKPQQVVYINNDVVNELHDTTWVYANNDTEKEFDFSNKYRELSGTVTHKDTTLALYINKDIVHLDYTMAIKDGVVYVSSSNPYVKFNDIQGITIPTTKQKRWHIGPAIGVGVGRDFKISPYVGVNLTYSIIRW